MHRASAYFVNGILESRNIPYKVYSETEYQDGSREDVDKTERHARPDLVVEDGNGDPVAIIDLKTGRYGTMRRAQRDKYANEVFAGRPGVIIILGPRGIIIYPYNYPFLPRGRGYKLL